MTYLSRVAGITVMLKKVSEYLSYSNLISASCLTLNWSFDNSLKLIPFQEIAKPPGFNKNQGRSLQGRTADKGDKQAIMNPPFKSKYFILNAFHYFTKSFDLYSENYYQLYFSSLFPMFHSDPSECTEATKCVSGTLF